MIDKIRRTLRALRSHTCGNATLLVAIGMPALIGSSGLAVDTAQWYTWKRELQFAVDQAALAGAWAQTSANSSATYQARAAQEFRANLAVTTNFATTPTISLASFAGGTLNSVAVTASATRELPFSSFLTGRATTVAAFAQAKFAEGATYTACLIATDEDDSGAITIGGNATLTAGCGLAALSNSPSSIIINGNPTVNAGDVLSKGGIDDWLDTHGDNEIHEYLENLTDPFAALVPPNNTTPQTYNCVNGATTTTATTSVTTLVQDKVYSGSNSNSLALVRTTFVSSSATPLVANNVAVTNGTVAGTVTSSSTLAGSTTSSGSGRNRVYNRTDRVTTTTTAYSNVIAVTTETQASLIPGTYTNLVVSCKTVFSPGIYVLNGGRLKITGQHEVTGAGVIFVLKNGAYIDIQGGSSVNLTAMSSLQLEAAGVSAAQANLLAGMLVFEDRTSQGTTNKNTMNGNASTVLNGTIYLPRSDITFAGTATVTSQCLMIAASRITIQGSANMSTFCPPDPNLATGADVSTSSGTVTLVV